MVYPKEALENKIQGTAHVKCEVNDSGKVLKAESIHKPGYGLDEEAERLCLLMKFENTVERGVKVKHTTTLKIPFVLPKETPLTVSYQITPSAEKEKGGNYNYTITL